MSFTEPTCIGKVSQVLGSTITIAIDSDLAGIAPIYRGRLQPIGQIGSLIRIPQGLVDLVATVTLLGISELPGDSTSKRAGQSDDRWLQAQLLGEVDRSTGKFRRGVATFPGLDDPVHFATSDELKSVFPPHDDKNVQLGRLSAAEEVPVTLDASSLVVRHSAIVGSTGSGKTSAVVSLLQSFVNGGWNAANIIVIDPHGEYNAALDGISSVRSVLSTGENRLCVPYWALPASDIILIFAGAVGGATFANRFAELVLQERRNFVEKADWIKLDPSIITADTPVPFSIHRVWQTLDTENRETREEKGDPETSTVSNIVDPSELKPSSFVPYGPAGASPHKGPCYDVYGTMPSLLRLGLLDPQLKFFLEPKIDPEGEDPLVKVMQEWLGKDKPISVLDFGGVPERATDVAIGVILNLLFEVTLRCPFDGDGIGRPSPVLIVLEEAHRYLGEEAATLTRDSANRIAREGRKYGIGLMLVTQRPVELPKTALSQCGTIIALRLSNAEDQGTIRSALPDAIAGLADILPSLRTHEAIVSGEALIIPARTLIDDPNPWPQARDPSLDPWRGEAKIPIVAPALAEWRGRYQEKEND